MVHRLLRYSVNDIIVYKYSEICHLTVYHQEEIHADN